MIESTIHCIYSFWNRVGLVLNTYIRAPRELKKTYFATIIPLLVEDYPTLVQNKYFQWISNVKGALDELNRNEFAHNNSLIMQNFLPKESHFNKFEVLLKMPEVLLSHNKFIANDIYDLVELVEELETLKYNLKD